MAGAGSGCAPKTSLDVLDPTLQEAILKINTEDITSLEQWTVGGLYNMATSTSGSRGTTISGNQSTPGFFGQEARRKVEERTKKRAQELVSESGRSSEDEEVEDPVTLNFDEEEYVGSKTPFQLDAVDNPEPLYFKINWPTTRSMPRKPTARPKRKATRNKLEGPSSGSRKKHRR